MNAYVVRLAVVGSLCTPGLLWVTACGKTIDETMDDATITVRVKTALLNEPDLAARQIDVDTSNGVVMLSGSVESPADHDRAIIVARRVPGVVAVESTLKIGDPPEQGAVHIDDSVAKASMRLPWPMTSAGPVVRA